jgi:dolichol-phosphate mannosyltransferase
MIMTGIMWLYVGRIHGEVKRRPLYVIAEQAGFARAAGQSTTSPRLRGDVAAL